MLVLTDLPAQYPGRSFTPVRPRGLLHLGSIGSIVAQVQRGMDCSEAQGVGKNDYAFHLLARVKSCSFWFCALH